MAKGSQRDCLSDLLGGHCSSCLQHCCRSSSTYSFSCSSLCVQVHSGIFSHAQCHSIDILLLFLSKISMTCHLIAVKYCADIHNPQLMNHIDFNDY